MGSDDGPGEVGAIFSGGESGFLAVSSGEGGRAVVARGWPRLSLGPRGRNLTGSGKGGCEE